MVRVALARPSASVSALVAKTGGALRNAPSVVSKLIFTLGTGLPFLLRASSVITDRPGSDSVTTTSLGLPWARKAWIRPGRVMVRRPVTDADSTCTCTSAPAMSAGKMRQVVALPGWAITGEPVCCTYWVTSQGGGALVVGKPMMLVRCDWVSLALKGTMVIDTGVPFSTVLPKLSVTTAVMVLRRVPSLLLIDSGLTVSDRRPGR